MNSSKISSFSVYGLFGTSDIHINFDENIKILVGENGIGKTQVLNLFYYTLTRDFFKLNDYNFDKLLLTFANKKSVEISKKHITQFTEETFKRPIIRDVIEDIGFANFEMLRNKVSQAGNSINSIQEYFSRTPKLRKYSTHRILMGFQELEDGELFTSDANSILTNIKHEILNQIEELEVLYFPTFRRVEEDLHNLGYDENDLNLNQENTLIQFGMDDVQKTFTRIESQIEQLLKEGLAVFLKDILNIVISKNVAIPSDIFDRISQDDLAIIFARTKGLGNEMKEAVLKSVKERQFNDPISGLVLQKLIELYENQKELDKAVILFKDVCNKYLINKKVFYNESGIKIFIKSDLTQDRIELKHLSSGEKQIISIFSKIYLSDADKNFIILLDEPELSLSMTWQKQLLPDLINSKKCNFLLAVTHSPFIFDNELDQYAVGLSESIKPIHQVTA